MLRSNSWPCNQLAQSLVTIPSPCLFPSAEERMFPLEAGHTSRRMRMRAATCCHLVVLPKCGSVLHIISYLRSTTSPPLLPCPALQQFYQFQCAHKCCRKPSLGARFNALLPRKPKRPFFGTVRYLNRFLLNALCASPTL